VGKAKFFLPTRKGSERVINKNTRDFAGVEGGLLKIKLSQLLKVDQIDEIIVSSNDPETFRVAESFKSSKITIVPRPDRLCLSSTNIEEFINYVPTAVDAEHIFWVHATAPFVNENDYTEALNRYWDIVEAGEYDSLISVTKIQQFLWDHEKKIYVNHDRSLVKWPRTQDLKPLYEINHAFYINSAANYIKHSDRIGINPEIFVLDKIKSFDIDWQDDFEIAELIYQKIIT